MSREDEYQLVETCRHLSRIGMMPASDGNCSLRLDGTKALITPTGGRKEQLKPQDLVQIDITAQENSDRASSEWRMHAAVLNAKEDINAVIHAHPVYLTAFGLRGEVPDANLLYETAETVGEIAFIPGEPPGTQEFAEAVVRELGDATVAILENHGAIAVGSSLQDAQFCLERAEHLAKVALLGN